MSSEAAVPSKTERNKAGRMKIVVIAPNISENLSGEAIKAFQYIRHLSGLDVDLTVIAHERSRGQFEHAGPGARILIAPDGPVEKLIWRTRVFRPAVTIPFFLKVRKLAREIAATAPETVFHYICPVSPIYPRLPVKGLRNVIGPLTGNIFYPPALRAREPGHLRWRRLVHRPTQVLFGLVVRDKRRFDRILISGGERTAASLAWAGGPKDRMRFVLDAGVSGKILNLPPVRHVGVNFRFVCNGRLDPHKGVDLAIRAVARARQPVTLDIFGKGVEVENLKALIQELGLEARVALRGWMPSHDALLEEMRGYRGFVFPSMAEANGIVVQETLAMGLPIICLNWGGPSVLTTDETARRIEPHSAEQIIDDIAAEMDRLAVDADLANGRAEAGLQNARPGFGWPAVVEQWFKAFA